MTTSTCSGLLACLEQIWYKEYFDEVLVGVLGSLLHHFNGTLLPGSLLTTYLSSRLVTLTPATPWLLTMTNTFDVTQFSTIITMGCAEQTLGGSVAFLATLKTTIASFSAHFMDFCLETSSCANEFSWLHSDLPYSPSSNLQHLGEFVGLLYGEP